MKYTRTIATLLLMLCLVVGSAHGQAGSLAIKATVPFRFAIGGTSFAAGEYSIYPSSDRIWVYDASGRNGAVSFTGALDGKIPEHGGKVVFDCYFDECFLSQVWISGLGAGRTLPKSKRQIQLAKTVTRQEFALLGTKPLR